jgi:hypothetical protein
LKSPDFVVHHSGAAFAFSAHVFGPPLAAFKPAHRLSGKTVLPTLPPHAQRLSGRGAFDLDRLRKKPH